MPGKNLKKKKSQPEDYKKLVDGYQKHLIKVKMAKGPLPDGCVWAAVVSAYRSCSGFK